MLSFVKSDGNTDIGNSIHIYGDREGLAELIGGSDISQNGKISHDFIYDMSIMNSKTSYAKPNNLYKTSNLKTSIVAKNLFIKTEQATYNTSVPFGGKVNQTNYNLSRRKVDTVKNADTVRDVLTTIINTLFTR